MRYQTQPNAWPGMGANAPLSAGSLLRAASAGDRQAFLEVMSGYDRLVLQLALHLTGSEPLALEIHREVFVRAYEALSRHDAQGSLFAWLCELTVQSWLKRSRNLAVSVPSSSAMPPETPAERLSWAMSSLSARERLVFVLKQQQGFNLDTIAMVINIDKDEVRTALDRAVSKLRAVVESTRDPGGALPAGKP